MSETFSVYYESVEFKRANAEPEAITECECRWVPLDQAKKWFLHHTTNVSSKVGLTRRVFIVDSGDRLVAEWKFGQGITWPQPLPGAHITEPKEGGNG